MNMIIKQKISAFKNNTNINKYIAKIAIPYNDKFKWNPLIQIEKKNFTEIQNENMILICLITSP